MDEKSNKISDEVINLEPIQINVTRKPKERKQSITDTFVESKIIFVDQQFDELKESDVREYEEGDILNIMKMFPATICDVFEAERSTVIRCPTVKANSLDYFQSSNIISISENNSEGDIEKTKSRSNIFSMKKVLPKKCRSCNYKKRSCLLNRSSCSAFLKSCFSCHKKGHFPKSLNCKRSRAKKQSKRTAINHPRTSVKQITEEDLELVNKRIKQLELVLIDNLFVVSDQKKKQNRSYLESIPFIMMYFFLNYECFAADLYWKNKSNYLDQVRKEEKLKKLIMKEAHGCASKMKHAINDEEKWYFTKYCSKKVQKTMNFKSSPKKEIMETIQRKIDAFEKMFYNHSEVDQRHLSQESTTTEPEELNESLISNSDNQLSEDLSVDNFLIPQLDGHVSESSEDEALIKKTLFSVKCESDYITQLITFFRSFDHVWKSLNFHKLCSSKQTDKNCFFCYMRSSCLRISSVRGRGPKSLKINEFTSQLDQYQSLLGWNWCDNAANIPTFIKNTLKLLEIYEKKMSSLYEISDQQCPACNQIKSFSNQLIHQVDTSDLLKEKENVNLKCLINALMKKNTASQCCLENMFFKKPVKRWIVLELSHPVCIHPSTSDLVCGRKLIITSSVSEETLIGKTSYCSHFFMKQKLYYQNRTGEICESDLKGKKIRLLSVLITNEEECSSTRDLDVFKFDNNRLKQLDRKCLSTLCPEEYLERKLEEKEYENLRTDNEDRRKMHKLVDEVRDQTENRRKMHRGIDQVRDQTDERRKMHEDVDQIRDQTVERKEQHKIHDKVRNKTEKRKNLDQVRDQTVERKEQHKIHDKVRNKTEKRTNLDKVRDKTKKRKQMHKKIDQKRNKDPKRKSQLSDFEQTETRRLYVNMKNRLRYQRKLYDTFASDTGFDVICSSCLQYKSLHYCKLVSTLTKEQIKKFIVKKCNLLKNRSDQQHVCNLCLGDIKQNKFPKRSHKDHFKFANFPNNFIKKLKKRCNFKEQNITAGHILDRVQYERDYLKLNRLESYLLKLVIPFIRIAHCPRGTYFKVKGDLILISSDISHSLSQILPLQQSLIPVCFKRKLSYTGSFIEEYIEKEKIQMYFTWLRENNHLYKDLELDIDLIDDFISESIKATKDFESRTKESEENISKSGDCEVENVEDIPINPLVENPFESYPLISDDQNDRNHDKTTIFMNKYCEDPNLPSVANKMAEMIVDYEMAQKVTIENDCDFELDDEIVTEEEFLRIVDGEMDEQLSYEMPPSDKSEQIQHKESNTSLDAISTQTEDQTAAITVKAKKQANKVLDKMEKIAVAPGEFGAFQNWGKDVFLEEKCFPEKFPFGTGGYLSSCLNDKENDMGFANYCINQIMSADPKFRNDSAYLFFILLVKELIQLKRCKTTYYRQASRLPNMTKENIINIDRSNLSRFNRSYQVFKNMRGTSMYYEESKKNLMAHLRQNGCPSVFLTLSCAEFDWPELLKEIVETVQRQKVTDEYIEGLSKAAKNKIISENVVQSTLHFQKRIDKLFSIMQDDFFDGKEDTYHVSSYFYRIEFQQRGAPHLHSLLWLKNKSGDDAPNFWIEPETDIQKDEASDMSNINRNKVEEDQERIKNVEHFADFLTSTSSEDISCMRHKFQADDQIVKSECAECKLLKEKIEKYQSHNHTFTCAKKMRTLTIQESEGHGRLDGRVKGSKLSNVPICRFRFPKFPLDETKLIQGISKDIDDQIIKARKDDLNKIVKFLIRQTFTDKKLDDLPSWKHLQELDFWQFLHEAGMFKEDKSLAEYTESEKQNAKTRYLEAISVSVQGSAVVVMKRKVKDIFVNGYNANIMRLHKANHDLQICIDQYSCAQYICGYLTKNESGISKLLKAVNEECNNLKEIDKLNALASILDKHREVSVQEAVYRLLSLPMTKSSVKVKYLSTVHPHFRDGLLKGKIDELSDDDSVFHTGAHEYYENRPDQSDDPNVQYDPEEFVEDYWTDISLAEFWSKYEIVYDKTAKNRAKEGKKTKIQLLKHKKGFIRKRSEMSILRYYLNYSNDEDLARGLLILFKPFRNEMKEIHSKDVKEVLKESSSLVTEKRKLFEKYKVMSDLIAEIHKEAVDQENKILDEDEHDSDEGETTNLQDIEDFNKWARGQASKELSTLKNLTDICDPTKLRSKISSLNEQQRRLFDDFTERMVSSDVNERPVYLFLSGNAGTGKSFLVDVLIEAVKLIKIKAGDELKKPPVIVMAPTANAAYIIGGKTIDSVLGFNPLDANHYTQSDAGRLATMKFQYENVKVIFCDEISMVGSMKLAKINYRFQDIADGSNKKEFMGGISFVASGDLWQLPPIYDSMVTEKNHLDGRPDCAPSHWNENFEIYYLTQKMRSAKDPYFSDLCDRVGRGNINDQDEQYLKSRIQITESEKKNESFKNGSLSIIVTTNKKKDLINKQKLEELIPNDKEYICNSVDRVTNVPGRKLPNRLKDNPGKTANLQTELRLKVGAPVLITSNHPKKKYKEDGIVNGARGFVQSIQLSKENPEKVDVIWVIFNKENIGRLYRFEHNHLRKYHNPGDQSAIPILPERKTFKEKFGNIEYQRTNFPLALAYAMTAHKCQGETLEEVIIDFGPDLELKIKNYICPGSFYVALTRVREGNKVFLKSFEKSFILVNRAIEEKVDAMKKFRPYNFKKIYLDQKIFKLDDSEIKAGYLNINGLVDGNHAEYLNEDHNLKNLDLLVLAETKLDQTCETATLKRKLSKWNIFNRYDSDDGIKHMGLMLLTRNNSSIIDQFKSVTQLPAKRNGKLQIQGLIVRFINGLNFGFIYCRSSPNNPEIKAINKYFDECNILMGDLNLSHRSTEDQGKIVKLCQDRKISHLKEITRTISNNQLEYILIDKEFVKMCFVTSYNNFISDHNSTIIRFGLNDNEFTNEIKERLTFDRDHHLREKIVEETSQSSESVETSNEESEIEDQEQSSNTRDQNFARRFKNIDMTTCWLNSCLQLLLIAMDHTQTKESFTSELGEELMQLKYNKDYPLDATNFKHILVSTEDTRIATRISELSFEIYDPDELEHRTQNIQNMRLNLISGQQCVRDFFLCLNENLLNWPDVFSQFGFQITHSNECSSCKSSTSSETMQIYIELAVPPHGSNLSDYIEDYFNGNSTVGAFCQNECKRFGPSEQRSSMTKVAETEFFIVVLTRAVETLDGYQLCDREVKATNDVLIR